MPHLSDIGARLVATRRARGMTQRELAELLGVHQQQIARWERDLYASVALARVSRVAEALGIAMWQGEPALPLSAEESVPYGGTAIAEPGIAPVRDLGEIVARIRPLGPELHERFTVTRIAVFGSFARGEQRPDSDVDLIVEVEHPSLENVFGPEEVLGRALGRKADTGSFQSLRPRVRENVREDLVDVWTT